MKAVNYKLEKGSTRFFGGKRENIDGVERVTPLGYVQPTDEEGVLLIHCGSSSDFNKELYEAIKGNIISREHTEIEGDLKRYFYNVKGISISELPVKKYEDLNK